MTVKELKERLNNFPENLPIKFFTTLEGGGSLDMSISSMFEDKYDFPTKIKGNALWVYLK